MPVRGSMMTQETQQVTRPVPGRCVIVFYILHCCAGFYGPLTMAVKSLHLHQMFQSEIFERLTAVRHGLAI